VIYFLDERNGKDLEQFGLHSISSSAFSCVVNIVWSLFNTKDKQQNNCCSNIEEWFTNLHL